MEGRRTRGRQRIEMKRRENEEDRHVTLSKRRSGIYKKANELATLCGAEVGIAVFSPAGKAFSYGSPSIDHVTNRFLNLNIQQQPANQNQMDFSHDLVEAHRQARVHYASGMYNALKEQLEAERAREKALKQAASARGSSEPKGWWEAPLEGLDFQGLKQMLASSKHLHNGLCSHLLSNGFNVINTNRGAASSSAAPAPFNAAAGSSHGTIG